MCADCTDDHRTPDFIVVCRDYRLYLEEHRANPTALDLTKRLAKLG
jgi:hypothetical protein